MERVIKFRGICTEAVSTHHEGVEVGEWVEGFLIEHNQIRITLSEEHGGMGPGFGYHHVKVDPKSVGQFTGLTDKAGREIFEKDKYRWTEKSDGTGNYEIGEIIFEDGMFWCKSLEYNGEPNDSNLLTLLFMNEEIEIIGNSFTQITKP